MFLEILFVVSFIELLITWVWFLILGFRANKTWGFLVLLLFPITPFMFASRFPRKARKAIYYYVVTLIFFGLMTSYIYFYKPKFYDRFWGILDTIKEITRIDSKKTQLNFDELFSTNDNTQDASKLQAISPSKTKSVTVKKVIRHKSIEKPLPKAKPYAYYRAKRKAKKQGYKTVSMNDLTQYINKKVIVSTPLVQHKGRLLSVTSSTIRVKKQASGGSVTMPIKKNKITHFKVYL